MKAKQLAVLLLAGSMAMTSVPVSVFAADSEIVNETTEENPDETFEDEIVPEDAVVDEIPEIEDIIEEPDEKTDDISENIVFDAQEETVIEDTGESVEEVSEEAIEAEEPEVVGAAEETEETEETEEEAEDISLSGASGRAHYAGELDFSTAVDVAWQGDYDMDEEPVMLHIDSESPYQIVRISPRDENKAARLYGHVELDEGQELGLDVYCDNEIIESTTLKSNITESGFVTGILPGKTYYLVFRTLESDLNVETSLTFKFGEPCFISPVDEEYFHAKRGDRITFEAEADGLLPEGFHYQWVFVENVPDVSNAAGKITKIEGANEDHYTAVIDRAGQYLCYLTNDYYQTSEFDYAWFTVIIDNNLMVSGSSSITVSKGDEYTLRVISYCDEGDLQYIWVRGVDPGNPDYVDIDGEEILESEHGDTLTATADQDYDLAYTVYVYDRYGNEKYADFYVEVDPNKEYLVAEDGVYEYWVQEGSDLTLECNAYLPSGKPVKYQWWMETIDDSDVQLITGTQVLDGENGPTLQIKAKNANYYCDIECEGDKIPKRLLKERRDGLKSYRYSYTIRTLPKSEPAVLKEEEKTQVDLTGYGDYVNGVIWGNNYFKFIPEYNGQYIFTGAYLRLLSSDGLLMAWDNGIIAELEKGKTYYLLVSGDKKYTILAHRKEGGQADPKAHVHTEVKIPGKAATCTEAGLTEGKKCSECGKVLAGQKSLKATGHAWSSWKTTKAATTEAEGQQTRTCKNCGKKEARPIKKIPKKAQTMTVRAKNIKIKAAKVKKKKQYVSKAKAFSIKKAQGSVEFIKLSGSKKVTISKKGRITVKKGTKKGTYKIKVRVTAAGNSQYEKGSKTVLLKIKIK